MSFKSPLNKINHESQVTMEQPFLKAPFEQLKKSARTSQKLLEREFLQINTQVEELRIDQVTDITQLECVLQRLRSLKRKVEDTKQEENEIIRRTKHRLVHLSQINSMESYDSEAYQDWNQIRVTRILIDYLLRKGYNQTAEKLIQAYQLENFVDTEIFRICLQIETAFEQRNCRPCLQWCHENRASLKKLKSALEFDLRLQEFIELVKEDKKSEAILYSRRFLSPWYESNAKQILQAMALLAFDPTTARPPYKDLFDDHRWELLKLHFRTIVYQLYSLSPDSILSILLQVGLTALKTPRCGEASDFSKNCPSCDVTKLGALAKKLPFPHHVHSFLVCKISGKIMNEHNPPMVLPNGYVYCRQALLEMAERHNGKITCIRTGDTFEMEDIRKIYIS